ncbi:hypothetical protein [Streptosporangium subroseum]|nr:hypothetical protein [Streptosporangium subroseum]
MTTSPPDAAVGGLGGDAGQGVIDDAVAVGRVRAWLAGYLAQANRAV